MKLSVGKQVIRYMTVALLLELTMVTITSFPPKKPFSREHFSRSRH